MATDTTDAVRAAKLTNDPVWRRFGRDHEKPCADPRVLTCSMWQCQSANRCRKYPALATATDALAKEPTP